MKSKLLLVGVALAMTGTAGALAQAPVARQPAHDRFAKTEARADVQAAVARQFARLDTNHDGFVTKAEVDGLETQRAAKFKQRSADRANRFDPAKMFGHLDTNHDGKITAAEAEAARNVRVGAKPGQPASAHAAAIGGLFQRGDTNKDGAITRAEFDAMATQMHERMGARMERVGLRRENALFYRADANRDGKVAISEMQKVALQHFDRADLNHDGKLTPEERKQARQQMRAAKPAKV